MADTMVTPSIEERVQRKVDSGRYPDGTAVLERALDALENLEKLRVLRMLIDEADESVARGEVYAWTPTLMAEIWAEADEDDRLGLPIPDHVQP